MRNPSNGSPPWSDHAFIDLVEARHLGGFRVWLRFEDGLEGELDLGPELHGEVFEPLQDPGFFARFSVDHTLTWPNGADFAPEFLHERLSAARAAGPGDGS